MSEEQEKITILSAEPDTLKLYLAKIWKHRHLIGVFAQRDLKLKYAQTFLGLGWLIGQPVLSLIIYSVFFGYLLKIDTFEYPYYLYVFSGLISWNLFSQIISQVSLSMYANKELITKVSFPKILFAFSKVVVVLIENSLLLLSFLITLILAHPPTLLGIIFALFILLIVVILSLSIGLLIAALSIQKRDLAFVTPHLMPFLIWFTPVFYPTTILPVNFQSFIFLNPIAALLDFFRWTLGLIPDINHFSFYSLIVTFVLFILAIVVFKKTEFDIVEKI